MNHLNCGHGEPEEITILHRKRIVPILFIFLLTANTALHVRYIMSSVSFFLPMTWHKP